MPTFPRPTNVTKVSSSFTAHTKRKPPSVNPGVDYATPIGTAVLSPAAGKVTRARWSDIAGYYVTIEHDNGWSSEGLHLSRVTVKEGQRVSAGHRIGFTGDTGSSSRGPHLHWILRDRHGVVLMNKGNKDPEKYVTKTAPKDILRTTGKVAVNARALPTTKAPVSSVAKPNTRYVVTGYALGQSVKGNNIWFRLKSGQWCWSGAFTSKSITGIPKITLVVPPVVVPELEAVKKKLAESEARVAELTAVIDYIRGILGKVK